MKRVSAFRLRTSQSSPEPRAYITDSDNRRNGREPRRLGTGLTRAGYVAAAVKHPGNNTIGG
jgi:hypothetical protein